MSAYADLGLQPIINASGAVTRLGGAPMPDLVLDAFRAVQEAEAQIDDELNRASDPRLRDQIGEGGQDDDELRRAADAARRGAEEGVDLPLFLRRAVEASQGEVSVATDHDVLSEDHPRIEAAVRWVRATRFRQHDDHRLAYVVVPDLIELDLVATFLLILADGTKLTTGRRYRGAVQALLDRAL